MDAHYQAGVLPSVNLTIDMNMDSQHQLLVVEDDAHIREAIVAVFSGQPDLQVHTADSGDVGLSMASRLKPDLMLLDVMMPGLNGFEVCRAIRNLKDLRELPVVMLTALSDRESRLKGIEAGADDFISKPFDHQELRARVACILRLNRYRKLLAEQARFRWLVEGAESPTLLVDPLMDVTYANPAARRLLPASGFQSGGQTSLFELLLANFTLEPRAAWKEWMAQPDQAPTEPLLLVRRGPTQAERHWYRFQVQSNLGAIGEAERAVHLTNVTNQMADSFGRWSFQRAVSHKLRTPLTGIIGCLELLEEDYCANATPEDVSLWESMRLSSRRLAGAIDDVLHYADIFPLTLWNKSFPFSRFEALVRRCAETARVKHLTVELAPELKTAYLGVSETVLEIILGELCANAVKFHPEQNPTVEVSLHLQGVRSMVSLRLRDDGVHLTPEDLANVWRPYFQAEPTITGEVPGIGLGLPLIAATVVQCGGTYEMANRPDRSGLEVRCTLPWHTESSEATC